MHFHMGEQYAFPIPPFHIEIFNLMLSESVSRLALAIPRGHNKTTLAKLAIVHYFLFTDYSFIVYVSNTAEIAQAACRDIIGFLTSRNTVNVFGGVRKIIWREGEGLFVFEIELEPNVWKKCILRALGAGQQVRGLNIDNRRPELGVVDDLEDDENTATPILQAKLNNWVFGAFLKAFNAWKAKILWLGNMLSNKSILHAHCKDPDWHSIRLGCLLDNGQPLWPDLWPIEAIRKDFNEYKRRGMTARWFAEMMNLPMPEGGSLIDANDIYYRPSVGPGSIMHGFITVDPAIGKERVHDFTGISVWGWIDDGWHIVETCRVKLNPIELFHYLMALCNKWSITIIGIESVAFQSILSFMFEYLLKQFPMNNIEIVKLTTTKRKTDRIQAFCGLSKDKQVSINEGEYSVTEQLLNYDPAKKDNDDDVIDACAHGAQMINEYGNMIFAAAIIEVNGGAIGQHEADVCRI